MSLKIHHLNCCTMCPAARPLINGDGSWSEKGIMVCHCLLIETNEGLVLIETGVGLQEASGQRSMPLMFKVSLGSSKLQEEQTAIRQIEKLGFKGSDVKHILITHLDLDHAGGLPDFPDATVHIYEKEYQAGVVSKSLMNRIRYERQFWEHGPNWQIASLGSDSWFGFDCVKSLVGLPDDILMVPLMGHSAGHCAIAVNSEEGWLMHCGDAYFHYEEMNVNNPSCPPGLQAFQTLTQVNRKRRLANQKRLRDLKRNHGSEVKLICAHDHHEFESCCH